MILPVQKEEVEDSFQLTTRDWAAFSAPPFFTHVYCNSNFPTLWVNNLLFIGTNWKFWVLCTKEKWTCSYEHVYKKTMQDVGAMFSDQLHIVYVTVCIYMNQFTTNIFGCGQSKLGSSALLLKIAFMSLLWIKLCIIQKKILVKNSEFSLTIKNKKPFRVGSNKIHYFKKYCDNSQMFLLCAKYTIKIFWKNVYIAYANIKGYFSARVA